MNKAKKKQIQGRKRKSYSQVLECMGDNFDIMNSMSKQEMRNRKK